MGTCAHKHMYTRAHVHNHILAKDCTARKAVQLEVSVYEKEVLWSQLTIYIGLILVMNHRM